jgi:hypothetical protein
MRQGDFLRESHDTPTKPPGVSCSAVWRVSGLGSAEAIKRAVTVHPVAASAGLRSLPPLCLPRLGAHCPETGSALDPFPGLLSGVGR